MTHKEYDAYCQCYSGGAISVVGDWLANQDYDYIDDEYDLDGFDMIDLIEEKKLKEFDNCYKH